MSAFFPCNLAFSQLSVNAIDSNSVKVAKVFVVIWTRYRKYYIFFNKNKKNLLNLKKKFPVIFNFVPLWSIGKKARLVAKSKLPTLVSTRRAGRTLILLEYA